MKKCLLSVSSLFSRNVSWTDSDAVGGVIHRSHGGGSEWIKKKKREDGERSRYGGRDRGSREEVGWMFGENGIERERSQEGDSRARVAGK